MLPPELTALLSAADAAEADARTIVAGLTDAQANWQPDGGAAWSVTQCLDHLARTNEVYVGRFLPEVERAGADGRGPFRGLHPTWFGRKFLAVLEPPVTQKAKAFKNIVPAPALPIADALARYVSSHEAYRRLVTASAAVDVNRVVVPNPFVRGLRVRTSTALQVIPAHDRRHLWQARQVLARPDFPRG
ncbi:MAG: DinB family protein [Vicinamibacterales bacterium]